MNPGTTTPPRIDEELLLLAAYLLSCGCGLLEEPQRYGPLRCIDAARRVLALAAQAGIDHEGITAIRAQLDDVMCGAMTDLELDTFLDRICKELAVLLNESNLIHASGS